MTSFEPHLAPDHGHPSPSSIEHLLAPIDLLDFCAEFWERRHLHLERDADHHTALLDHDRIESLIADAAAAPADTARLQTVRLVDGRPQSFPLSPGATEADVRDALVHAVSSGYSVIANGLHHFDAQVSMATRAFEDAFGHPCGANLYLTPPEAAGLAAHHDPLESFLLQLSGSKTWHLAPPLHDLPLVDDEVRPGAFEPTTTVRLTAGDLLYIPRGWLHAGESHDDLSVHLSVQANPVRWVDLVVELVRIAARSDPGLRTSVPLQRATTGEDRRELDETARSLLARVVSASSAGASAAVLTPILRRRPRPIGGYLRAVATADSLEADQLLERVPGMWPIVTTDGDAATIHFSGSYLSAPAEAAEALEFVARTRRFRPAELPGLADLEQRLAVCRALVREGLVTSAP